MLRIVTDSASDITLEEARKQNVELVYLSIHFEDGVHPHEALLTCLLQHFLGVDPAAVVAHLDHNASAAVLCG